MTSGGPLDELPSRRLLGRAIRPPVIGAPPFLRRHLTPRMGVRLNKLPSSELDLMALQLQIDWASHEADFEPEGTSLANAASYSSEAQFLDLLQLALRAGEDPDFVQEVDGILATAGSA